MIRLQAADKPHCSRKGSGLELGQLDLQVADKPINLTHARLTMLCIHLVHLLKGQVGSFVLQLDALSLVAKNYGN